MIEITANCIICRQPTLCSHAPFCGKCSPAYGQTLDFNHGGSRYAIHMSVINPQETFSRYRAGVKIIRAWVGTDVLLLHRFPPGRGKLSVARHRIEDALIHPFVYEHWVNGERLFNEFVAVTGRRNVRLIHWLGKNFVANKTYHEGLNVAYYAPKNDKYSQWVYGLDVMEKVIEQNSKLQMKRIKPKFIKLDGKINMKDVYPILDGYIRPTRHDGWPRMIHECAMNNVPYFWSMESLSPHEFVCENPLIENIDFFLRTL